VWVWGRGAGVEGAASPEQQSSSSSARLAVRVHCSGLAQPCCLLGRGRPPAGRCSGGWGWAGLACPCPRPCPRPHMLLLLLRSCAASYPSHRCRLPCLRRRRRCACPPPLARAPAARSPCTAPGRRWRRSRRLSCAPGQTGPCACTPGRRRCARSCCQQLRQTPAPRLRAAPWAALQALAHRQRCPCYPEARPGSSSQGAHHTFRPWRMAGGQCLVTTMFLQPAASGNLQGGRRGGGGRASWARHACRALAHRAPGLFGRRSIAPSRCPAMARCGRGGSPRAPRPAVAAVMPAAAACARGTT
jgi:hypothetical protein